MSTDVANQQGFNELIAQNQAALPARGLPWLNVLRRQAGQSFKRRAVPNRKQETWRYSDPARLFEQDWCYQAAPFTALQEDDIEAWVYPAGDSYRLVFANGRYVPALSHSRPLPDGIKLGSLREMLEGDPAALVQRPGQTSWYNTDVFTELNQALLNDGLFMHVPPQVVVDKPIEVVYVNLGVEQPVLAQPTALLILETGARAKLVERFISTGDSGYFFNALTEVFLGEQAGLQHYRLQNESDHAYHLSRVAIQQDAASEYRGLNIASGGAWSRTDIYGRFNGRQASCELDGLYSVGDGQYRDFHLDIRHSRPACRSRENFRGLVFGKGRAVFDGRILVEKGAQQSDAQLTNKNLLLSPHAEVDSKPQLEIYADDVKCSHGATVGRLDPQQLFYLRSRGIDVQTARKLLCLGFAEQVLTKLEDTAVRDFIQAQLSEHFVGQEVKES